MLLLDECISPTLQHDLPGFECRTVLGMGWSGLTDDEVLDRSRGTFSAILTWDRRFARRRQLRPDDPAILLLRPRSNLPSHMRELLPKVIAAMAVAQPGAVVEIRWWD